MQENKDQKNSEYRHFTQCNLSYRFLSKIDVAYNLYLVSDTENPKIKLDDFTITNTKKEKLVDIIFDDKLKFQYQIENLCKKVSSKLSALSRDPPFVNLPQKKLLNAFFQSQFSCCPLVWMCHRGTLNNK